MQRGEGLPIVDVSVDEVIGVDVVADKASASLMPNPKVRLAWGKSIAGLNLPAVHTNACATPSLPKNVPDI